MPYRMVHTNGTGCTNGADQRAQTTPGLGFEIGEGNFEVVCIHRLGTVQYPFICFIHRVWALLNSDFLLPPFSHFSSACWVRCGVPRGKLMHGA